MSERLLELVEVGENIRGRVVFGAGYAGFDGHFVGNPILPGFLQVEAAVDLVRRVRAEMVLKGVEAGKFVRPIRPGEDVEIEITLLADEAGGTPAPQLREYGCTLSVHKVRCSQFRLMLRQE